MALSDYVTSFLGNISDYLGYTSADFSQVVDDTLEVLDLSSEADVNSSNQKSVHAVIKVYALEKCLNDLSVDFQFSADGSSYSRQQVYDQVMKRLELALSEAEQYLPEFKVATGVIDYSENPYDVKTYVNWYLTAKYPNWG